MQQLKINPVEDVAPKMWGAILPIVAQPKYYTIDPKTRTRHDKKTLTKLEEIMKIISHVKME